MARELIIHTWCDPHMAAEEHVVGEERSVSIDGGKPVTVALCPEHMAEYLAPLARLVQEHGYTPNGAKAPQGAVNGSVRGVGAVLASVPCPECGRAYPGRKGVTQHLRTVHGIGSAEADKRWPTLAPRVRTGLTTATCPECGRTFGSNAGLSAHLRGLAHSPR